MRSIVNLKQETEYSCGASCVLSILKTIGISAKESEIRYELRTNPRCGTAIESIRDYFRIRGFKSYIKRMDTCDLQEVLSSNAFLILLMQYYDEGAHNENSWEEGHYCILTDIDDYGVWLHDPYRGREICLTHQELKGLWHDMNYGKVYCNVGVYIRME